MSLTRPRAHQLLDIDFKQSCRAVQTSNVTLSGGAPSSVDGVNLARFDRVLVTGQSTPSQNGIYRVTTVGTGSNGTWQRAPDANATGDITAGLLVTVTEGTTYADSRWKLETPDPITLGSTNLTFSTASVSGGINGFSNISVGGTYVVAETPGDLLTLSNGNNIVMSGNASTDTITVAVSDSPSFSGYVSVAGGDGGNSSLVLDGYNQRGGVGYHGFLEVTNTYGSAANPSKHFRIAADGSLEIVNSGYSANLFTLSDAGQLYLSQVIASSSTTTGTLRVGGGAGIGGNLNVGSTITGGSINSTPIGNATASSGAFTTLSASNAVTFTPTNANLNFSPTGTGTVTINPATVGAINGMVVGNTNPQSGAFTSLSASSINSTPIGNATPSSGAFTTLSASDTVTFTPANASLNFSPTGTGSVTISPATQGSINKMVIGNVTAAAGTFTTLSSNSTTSLGLTSATAINSTPIGNATPGSGAFTTLTANGATTFTVNTASTSTSTGAVVVTGGAGIGGAVYAGSIQNTPIGNATASSGAFTTLTSNGATTFTSSTASSSSSTGAVVVTGGVGIGGNLYVGTNLVLTGNLTVNGTTTTVNSTVTTVDDPIFTIGGDTAPGADDNKDRGIEFRWHNGSVAKLGFFGYDDSTGRFTFIPDATNTSEVFSGTVGDAQFGTVYATATSAQYADLAEYYLSDAPYEPGTVVVLGGDKEITESKIHADRRIAGVISTQPAYTMNDTLKGIGLPVALMGRVPCKVKGYAHKGDLIVSSSTPGVAVAWGDFENPPTGAVIGKCLVNKETADTEIIEVLVGRI